MTITVKYIYMRRWEVILKDWFFPKVLNRTQQQQRLLHRQKFGPWKNILMGILLLQILKSNWRLRRDEMPHTLVLTTAVVPISIYTINHLKKFTMQRSTKKRTMFPHLWSTPNYLVLISANTTEDSLEPEILFLVKQKYILWGNSIHCEPM